MSLSKLVDVFSGGVVFIITKGWVNKDKKCIANKAKEVIKYVKEDLNLISQKI